MSLQPYEPPSGALAQRPADVDSWTTVLAATAQLAEQICNTDFVPRALRGNAAAVTAAMLTGRELGIGPMTSLAHIHVVNGKPGQSAQLMRQLVLAAGHQLEYVETNDTRCVVEGRRRGEDKWTRVSFTADQAKKAGIQLGGYPEDKLVARATSRLCRRKFADCLGGLPYTIEELEDGGETDHEAPPAAQAINQQPARRTAQRRTQPRTAPTQPPPATQEPADEPDGPPLPGEDGYDDQQPEEPKLTKPQLDKILVVFDHSGIKNRETRLQACSLIVGRELTSSNDLTKQEASRLIDQLEQWASEGNLAETIAELIGREDGAS